MLYTFNTIFLPTVCIIIMSLCALLAAFQLCLMWLICVHGRHEKVVRQTGLTFLLYLRGDLEIVIVSPSQGRTIWKSILICNTNVK